MEENLESNNNINNKLSDKTNKSNSEEIKISNSDSFTNNNENKV